MSGPTVMPLALRVRPKPYEGAASLLARLAARYGDTDLTAFCRENGLDRRSLSLGHGVDRLAALARVDAAELMRASPRVYARARTVRIGHAVIGRADWTREGTRYCPHCVRDDALVARKAGRVPAVDIHRRLWWDVRPVTRCPTHGTALAKACPRCGADPAWGVTPGTCGACGRGLAATRPPSARGQTGFSEYVAARLAGWPVDVPLLDGMELRAAVAQMELLGLAVTCRLSAAKPRRIEYAASGLSEAGFEALGRWPGSLDVALDRHLSHARQGSTGAGLIGAYGWVYEHWAAKLDPASAFGVAVRSAVRDHAVRHAVISEREDALLAGPSRRGPGLTGTARALGWGYERTRREVSRRGLIPRGSRRGVSIRISPPEVEAILLDRADLVGIREVSRLLDIGKTQAARVVAAGLLGVPETNPARVRRAACAELVRRLGAGATRAGKATPLDLPLPRACQAAGVPVDEACRRILEGGLAVLCLPGRVATLPDLFVNPAALRPPRSGDTVGVTRAAAALGLHPEAARHLARRGLLGRRCGVATRVDGPGLARFRTAYMTGSEAAALFGTSPRAVVSRLGRLSIAPVAAPPACRQVIYRRDDVETAYRTAAAAEAPGVERTFRPRPGAAETG